ncbi:MAG: six-hairpin glycosidase-like family protein [Paenibacillaceae bacterium]|nr:six-hairpin glycosidase-like family protein [Paenibacillaceae bacterium]
MRDETVKHKYTNRLLKEKSPYLLQHAYNPVDWYPWGEEAFAAAKRENKPIFLSIGYSTCHWCHVMERESFEDDEVAQLLNRDFISIKVDREERPDIDHIYMAVCQALTGQGGWPLTVLMAPDKKPFFAGTYFPKERKYGRSGLMNILPQIADKWREAREEIDQVSEKVANAAQAYAGSTHPGKISPKLLDEAFDLYTQSFDPEFGGFGSAPKFPSPHNLSLLLRYYRRSEDRKALDIVETTLQAMYRGGIYDHIGYGFARYSTDEKWLIPHFEKMLYDNALLAAAYLDAFQLTGEARYAKVAEEIFTYVMRDMKDPGGAFYSAEDADSEGVEGKFYAWTPDEVEEVLGTEEARRFNELFDITEEGNFEGTNIPNLLGLTLEQYAEQSNIPRGELEQLIKAARLKLFVRREQRIHPHKDDKILTSWNGLMIMALAKAAKALQRPDYAKTADVAVHFIWSTMRRSEDSRLLARYRDGEAAFPGYLDDYAMLAWGLIELYEATFDITHLQKAVQLTEEMIDLFWDGENGGFYFYGNDSEPLLARPKELYDGAMPSGNSVAALVLNKLSKFTYNAQFSQKADELLESFAGAVERYPAGHAQFLAAVDYALSGGGEIVIVGDPAQQTTKQMIAAIQRRYLPNAIMMLLPPGEEGTEARAVFPLAQDKVAIGGRPTVYICENYSCQSPVTELEELEELLQL